MSREKITFTDEEKIKFFDMLFDNFMGMNFNKIIKSDIEVLLFHFYLKSITDKNQDKNDKTIDYRCCSDYLLSQELGITQQKVRNLKIKSQLAYPIDFKWQLSFARLVQNARYDEKSGKIIINIPDPNLFIEIQNQIESDGKYIELQLNSKLLQIRVEYFIDLVLSLEEESKRKDIIKELKKNIRKQNKDEKGFDKKSIGKIVCETSDGISSVCDMLNSVIGLFSPKPATLLSALCTVVKK